MMNKQYYMYVLLCADGSLYTGYTTDVNRREDEHNTGVGAKYTKPNKRRPCQMLFSKAYSTRSEAMSAEYHFKQLNRQQKENKLRAAGVMHFNSKRQVKRIEIVLEQ